MGWPIVSKWKKKTNLRALIQKILIKTRENWHKSSSMMGLLYRRTKYTKIKMNNSGSLLRKMKNPLFSKKVSPPLKVPKRQILFWQPSQSTSSFATSQQSIKDSEKQNSIPCKKKMIKFHPKTNKSQILIIFS